MILYGASGHAKVIIDILKKMNIKIIAIVDDYKKNSILDYKVTTPNKINFDDLKANLIFAIGNNKVREELASKYKNTTFGLAIHPKSIIDKTSTINTGTVIMANAIINSSVTIGKHCIINTNSVIEHDCVINNYTHVSPSATLCGNVTVGEGTHIGAGAIIIPNIKIGKWCTIGAGSVVIKDIPDHTTVVGNPARII